MAIQVLNNGETQLQIRTKINSNFAELDSKAFSRYVASVAKADDSGDNVVIGAGELDQYKLLPIDVAVYKLNGFSAITNGIQYDGLRNSTFLFNATATTAVDTNGTIIHFILAVNGVPQINTTSSVKLASATDFTTINAATTIELTAGDQIQIYAKADKATTITSYHLQATFVEL